MVRALGLTLLPLLFAATPALAQQEDTQAWEQVNVVLPIGTLGVAGLHDQV